MSSDLLLAKALQLEIKAHQFYTEAADKIRALSEVSRALTRTATRRAGDKTIVEKLSH